MKSKRQCDPLDMIALMLNIIALVPNLMILLPLLFEQANHRGCFLRTLR
jgi:hypothetical protein